MAVWREGRELGLGRTYVLICICLKVILDLLLSVIFCTPTSSLCPSALLSHIIFSNFKFQLEIQIWKVHHLSLLVLYFFLFPSDARGMLSALVQGCTLCQCDILIALPKFTRCYFKFLCIWDVKDPKLGLFYPANVIPTRHSTVQPTQDYWQLAAWRVQFLVKDKNLTNNTKSAGT